MINANELRLGNYLQLDGENYHVNEIYNNLQCVELKRKNLENPKLNDYEECDFDCNDLHPIPITEEWLLKLGFECIADAGDQKRFALKNRKPNYYYGVELDHEEICLNKQSLFGCETIIHNEIFFQYVHQLQNLFFALTGEELQLN